MKVIQFTIPVAIENSIVVQEEKLPFFYNHLHRHNETQVTWILKGEGTLIAGNYMQRFKAGDIYIVGANQPHIFKSDPVYFDKKTKKEVQALTIFFNPNGHFRAILELPEAKAIKRFVGESAGGLQVPPVDQKKAARAMLAVKNSKQGLRLAHAIQMLQTMATIKNWKKLAANSSEYSFSDHEGLRMNEVYQFTMEHYSETIKLQQVADKAFLTPQAFCRYFKKHTRKTYIAFLSEIRVNEACKKIISGEFESISSVAYDTGFTSAVSFNRVFKKITGKPPREYLKEYQQKVD
jgi:AraC-like DNA-binding protein